MNQPGDCFEQEAERIAAAIMRQPDFSYGATPRQGLPQLQRAAENFPAKITAFAPPAVHKALRAGGQPLDPATRAFAEPRFGYDFSRVRIHTGPIAEQSAREVNAQAYTVGRDIVFGANRFAPGTAPGRHLLAHELAHVVQQQGAASPAGLSLQSKPDDGVIPAHPSLIKAQPGPTHSIKDAYAAGVLDEKQWSQLVDSARKALTDGDAAKATKGFLTLFADIDKLAQPELVLPSAGEPNTVHDTGAARKGVKPGLNLSLFDNSQAYGETGFVNDAGDFGVLPSLATGTPQVQVAVVIYQNAFRSAKEQTLATLRHEMMHAQHANETLAAIATWQKDSKPKRDKKLPPDQQFITWLRQRLSKNIITQVDDTLIEESSGAGLTSAHPNTEVLAHLEGFMTEFHLIHPAPTDPGHPVFMELLGILTGDEGPRWARADPAIRNEALGRLQEYYCHTLDPEHQKALEDWATALATKTQERRAQAEKTKDKGAEAETKTAEKVMREHFLKGLQEIFSNKCKGLVPEKKATAPANKKTAPAHS